MKEFKELIRYHFVVYMKTNKYIMPLLAWIMIMFCAYMQKPLEIVSSYMVSLGALFFVATWVNITYLDSVDQVGEQIMLLKASTRRKYYASKVTFMILLGAILSLIGVFFPVVQNIANGGDMFTRSFTGMDIVSSALLHLVVTCICTSVALLFQPQVMKNRKMSLLCTVFVLLFGLLKLAIRDDFPVSKYFLWIFPPMSDILSQFSNIDIFYVGSLCKASAFGIVYSLVLVIIAQSIVNKKLYG